MISFSNDELDECPEVDEGYIVHCAICGGEHPLECSTDTKTKEKTTDLMFYRCGERMYLGAVKGRLVVSIITKRKAA